MQIHSEARIAHPRDRVFAAYRDQLCDLVPYLPDIKDIVVHDRKEEGSKVTLHNEWVADTEIPRAIRAIVRPEHLRWDDYAEWDEDAYSCAWHLKTRAFTDALTCSGRNLFYDDGGSTRVVLTGELSLDLRRVRGVPRIGARTMGTMLEKFVVAMITPNLQRVNSALQPFLDAQGGA